MTIEFEPFPKIARLTRDCVITEKIDGTNGQVIIGEDGEFATASRTRIITPEDDNFGFSRWAHEHKDELIEGLGIGRHFGEWWGSGIQRRYGLDEKRFSLFNTGRWNADNTPNCVSVVPVVYAGVFNTDVVDAALDQLKREGSLASPGFDNPEGVVIYHTAAGVYFKKTIEKDEEWKGKAAQ